MNTFLCRARTFVVLAGLLAAGCAHHASSGAAASPRDQKARELLEVTGTRALQQQGVDQLVTELEQSGEYPSDFLARFRELVATGDLPSALIRVYERHLDERTIEAAATFFGSPSGRAYQATEPAVARDLLQAANEWITGVSACAAQENLSASPVAAAKRPSSASHGEAMAREFLDLTAGNTMGPSLLEDALVQIDNTKDIPAGYRDRFERCAKQDDFQNYVVSVFARDVDDATLDATLAFYRTDSGREFAAAQTAISKEVPKATAKWTAKLILRAHKETAH